MFLEEKKMRFSKYGTSFDSAQDDTINAQDDTINAQDDNINAQDDKVCQAERSRSQHSGKK